MRSPICWAWLTGQRMAMRTVVIAKLITAFSCVFISVRIRYGPALFRRVSIGRIGGIGYGLYWHSLTIFCDLSFFCFGEVALPAPRPGPLPFLDGSGC